MILMTPEAFDSVGLQIRASHRASDGDLPLCSGKLWACAVSKGLSGQECGGEQVVRVVGLMLALSPRDFPSRLCGGLSCLGLKGGVVCAGEAG